MRKKELRSLNSQRSPIFLLKAKISQSIFKIAVREKANGRPIIVSPLTPSNFKKDRKKKEKVGIFEIIQTKEKEKIILKIIEKIFILTGVLVSCIE